MRNPTPKAEGDGGLGGTFVYPYDKGFVISTARKEPISWTAKPLYGKTEAERAEEYLQQREAKEAAAERSRRTAERRAQADEQKQKETPPPFVI